MNREISPSFLQPNAAMYALAGAVVGAAASLLGAYVTSESQSKLDSLATKREAFAAFVAEGEEYGRQLLRTYYAVADGDMAKFEEEDAALDVASGELYAAFSVVWLVGDVNAATAARDFRSTITDWDGPDEIDRDSSVASIRAAVVGGGNLLPAFIDAARDDLDDE